MTFKELSVGQRFRLARGGSQREWVKVEPVTTSPDHPRYNATADSGQTENFGHSAKVLTPPYGDTTQADRQQRRYQRLKTAVQAAGWSSVAELESAMLNGWVAVPQRPAELDK